MANQRQAEVVLARWREVERTIASLRDGDERLEAFHYEAARLRDEYQALVRATEGDDAPRPKPVSEASAG
jgi:hypothetical protein